MLRLGHSHTAREVVCARHPVNHPVRHPPLAALPDHLTQHRRPPSTPSSRQLSSWEPPTQPCRQLHSLLRKSRCHRSSSSGALCRTCCRSSFPLLPASASRHRPLPRHQHAALMQRHLSRACHPRRATSPLAAAQPASSRTAQFLKLQAFLCGQVHFRSLRSRPHAFSSSGVRCRMQTA